MEVEYNYAVTSTAFLEVELAVIFPNAKDHLKPDFSAIRCSR
jgi:hypothetical protein